MAKTDFKSVVEYIRAQPRERQATLRRVRQVLQKAVPKADEGISYQIPAYKLEGKAVIYFAAWKEHYALYPISQSLYLHFKGELARHDVRKATIRIPWDRPVPAGLITRIARFRAKEASAGRKIKPTAKRSTKAKS
jgi:uncharacterized protein YdhG (YjbR/CyaY superfamily)